MSKKIKKFFSNEKLVSKLIFATLIIGVVLLITGHGVFAYFKRIALDSEFKYGYGYGYADLTGYGYGYGYGYGANVSDVYDYGFWGTDGKATSVSAAVSGNTALVISYSTSYLAKNRVYYGTTNTGTCSTLGSSSSQTSFQSGSNSITISSLSCGTTYYYCVGSEDAGGNEWYTSISSQSTAPCGGGGGAVVVTPAPTVPTTETGEVTATPSAGGETTLTSSEESEVKVTIPADAVSANTTVAITEADASTLISEGTVGAAPTALYRVGNLVFSISATDEEGNIVSEFSKAVTLTFTYTDEQVEGLDEDTLQIYKWTGTEWLALDSTVDTVNNTVTTTLTELSYFALMGEKAEEVPVEEVVKKLTKSELKAKIITVIKQLISLISQLIAQLQAQLQQLLEVPQALTLNLSSGASGDEVELLQTWLAKDATVYPEGLITGWFGPLTKQAVIRFQEKYAAEILTPLGLTEGNGFVGEKTRAKLNELYSQ